MNEKESMSKSTKDLVGKAMRPDQRLQAEDLVANELATAILAESMPKIRHIIEALMLLDHEEREAAHISEDEVKEAQKIYRLCTTLSNAYIDKFEDDYDHVIERSATIPWPFDQEEAETWLDWAAPWPWRAYGDDKQTEQVVTEAEELAEAGEEAEAFWLITQTRVTIDTLYSVRIQFINYAMPKATKLMKKIIQVVSSSSFQAAMKRLKGGSKNG